MTVGQLVVLGAAVSVAIGSVLLERFEATIDSVPLTAWSIVFGAGLLYACSAALGESLSSVALLTPNVIAALLVVGLASTAISYPIYFTLIRRIGPFRTNLIAYIAPLFAAITGWLLLGESVTLATVVGFLIVVAAIALLERQVVYDEVERINRLIDHTF